MFLFNILKLALFGYFIFTIFEQTMVKLKKIYKFHSIKAFNLKSKK